VPQPANNPNPKQLIQPKTSLPKMQLRLFFYHREIVQINLFSKLKSSLNGKSSYLYCQMIPGAKLDGK
jgi:hypothetical protein